MSRPLRLCKLIVLLLSILLTPLTAYEKPSNVSERIWKETSPYFLPEDNPASSILLKIFQKKRATLNSEALKKAGFTSIKTQPYTKVTTATHPTMPTLFFKLYFDSQKQIKKREDHVHWLARIRGAELIGAVIHEMKWDDSFKVPRKWIFPLPKEPAPPSIFGAVRFILVEENMKILSEDENLAAWKGPLVTEKLLDRLYFLVSKLGLSDCLVPHNIPFSYDNKVAFIDTEIYMSFHILYKSFARYLSPEMAAYWESLDSKKVSQNQNLKF
ncbi:hypothetical protein [Estrella lausannensis]|uniref:Uncharacterized protein n=1 Tax=Estrella lausannensis TaxID=483423 RepID=A0A0H5DQJ9_9BACT|nr:hypothetical protein [Estrella lausannensis]CRX38358.1 conserved hypothetical protein [Estrella lausannensis]